MKNIIKSIALIAAASLMLACNKEAPSKAEVESGFTPVKVTLPTITLADNIVCDALNGTAVVSVTINNLDPTLDSLSVGVISSTDSTFATSKFTPIANPADGTVNAIATVAANRTYFIKAVVACTAGSAFSETKKVDVPDIPFWSKIPGVYTGHIVSAMYKDEYDNVITIIQNPDDKENSCFIQHLEPYYYSKHAKDGYPDNYYVEAAIDNDKKTISVAVGADYHHGTVLIAGLNNASMKAATGYAPLVFSAVDDDTLLMENAFYTLSEGDSGLAPEDGYNGGVKYTR